MNRQKGRCLRCGGDHPRNDCRLPRDTKCHNCNKTGHLSKVCLSRGPQSQQPNQPANPSHTHNSDTYKQKSQNGFGRNKGRHTNNRDPQPIFEAAAATEGFA
eukprot:GHVR01113733.1.p2 GENE.GHVR01113733.1~~GHVR01113733.1.p2  ORF type:complete len:102 (-),score=11.77 GHVR01113733.1:4727-5032(-)